MLGIFSHFSIAEVRTRVAEKKLTVEWLWPGYLARGHITVLTSPWKSGKTTLLVELLRAMGQGEPLLGRPVSPGTAVVLTEELLTVWSVRHDERPFGEGLSLVKFTDDERPTPENWDHFLKHYDKTGPDLFVVDPLANFLPPHAEGNTDLLLRFLGQLRNFARVNGPAVLLLHHPRKDHAAGQTTARGAGVLSSFADILLEFNPDPATRDDGRRILTARSRFVETPRRLTLDRDPTGRYQIVDNPERRNDEARLALVRDLLADHPAGLTVEALHALWPPGEDRPGRSTLFALLRTACRDGTLMREGQGGPRSPWRYRVGGNVASDLLSGSGGASDD